MTGAATRRRAVRVLPEEAVARDERDLSQVPEWGTGRRAKLEGIKTAGKTGTTSAYRDAWFFGFTGNFTAAVWMGNDDYSSTRRLTGGIASGDGLEQIHDLRPQRYRPEAYTLCRERNAALEELVADANGDGSPEGASGISDVPGNLSLATTERLIALEKMMREAPPLRPFAGLWPPSPVGLTGARPVAEKPSAVLPMEPIGPPLFPITQ